jgi:hypothetical protein
MMKRQCKLEKNEFIDLANCPLSATGYLEILKRNGIITQNDIELSQGTLLANGKRKSSKKK